MSLNSAQCDATFLTGGTKHPLVRIAKRKCPGGDSVQINASAHTGLNESICEYRNAERATGIEKSQSLTRSAGSACNVGLQTFAY